LSVDNLRMTGRELSFRSQLEAAARRGSNSSSFQEAEASRRGNSALETDSWRGSNSTAAWKEASSRVFRGAWCGEDLRRGEARLRANRDQLNKVALVFWRALVFWKALLFWRAPDSSKQMVLSALVLKMTIEEKLTSNPTRSEETRLRANRAQLIV